ncbi:MAG: hypothetical protein AB8B93_02575 [Pseudomonadales bacterium]
MTNNNPAQDLLNRLQSQFGEPLTDAAETIVERFLAPFALVPKHEFENHLELLTQLEQSIETLGSRVTELEQQAQEAAKKNSGSKKSGKKKSGQKKAAKKKAGKTD